MNAVFHDVSELHSGKEKWRIMVKVIRMWYSQGFASSKLPLSLEVVLMDSKGTKIHASIKKTLMYKFDKLLVDGNVYSLSSFVVVDSFGEYKTTRHNYKISFMFNTEVRALDKNPMDIFPYSFVSFAEILSPAFDTTFLVDVIGILTGVGVEREIVTNGKKSKMNVLEIESAGLRIECAVFGVYVDELNNFLGGGDINNPVVIVHFAKVKSFQGHNSLQNVHGATKILYDPDVPMAAVMKTRFLESSESGSWSLSQLSESKSVSGEDEFLVPNFRKTIAEMKDLKNDCICVVYGIICPMEDGVEWWYTACRCNRKVYADEKMYFCEGCNRHVIAVYPRLYVDPYFVFTIEVLAFCFLCSAFKSDRYRLQLVVEDATGTANFVLFDKEASLLVGKSCTEMVDASEKVVDV
ncbi:uncharacterized protein LOC130713448 [Lotus japonicus]|uniref:uncharacterized protein LOC130713448 n=1 Tax=Lotus japonicus TaxID=34305 RepID=UPI00258AA02E|nr:uncharacterized protein LOC130713448 [Lotus japonicus]